MIDRIKEFLKQKGLNWTGEIITYKDEDFKIATNQDFKEKDIFNFKIKFNECFACIAIEIDLANFYILGELKDVLVDNYIGYNLEFRELLTQNQRDLSKEWIDFQLKNSPLIYSTALRKYCEKAKQSIEKKYEDKEKILTTKLKNLQQNKAKLLKEYEDLEELIENANAL